MKLADGGSKRSTAMIWLLWFVKNVRRHFAYDRADFAIDGWATT
jgi:hypothetical protein